MQAIHAHENTHDDGRATRKRLEHAMLRRVRETAHQRMRAFAQTIRRHPGLRGAMIRLPAIDSTGRLSARELSIPDAIEAHGMSTDPRLGAMLGDAIAAALSRSGGRHGPAYAEHYRMLSAMRDGAAGSGLAGYGLHGADGQGGVQAPGD